MILVMGQVRGGSTVIFIPWFLPEGYPIYDMVELATDDRSLS